MRCPCLQATLSLSRRPEPPAHSDMTRAQYMAHVGTVKEHIQAGDIFQLVLSHRFKRRTFADPFEIYRRGLHMMHVVLLAISHGWMVACIFNIASHLVCQLGMSGTRPRWSWCGSACNERNVFGSPD